MRAVITGGLRGIGYSTAVLFGKEGHEVIFTGKRKEAGEETEQKLKEQGIRCKFIYGDSSKEEDVKQIFDEIRGQYDSIDCLVNNVGGLGGRQKIEGMETSFMRQVMALNFDSAFFACREAIELLKKGSSPSIINFSSIAVTLGGGPGSGIYVAAKGAIDGLTRYLAKELSVYGIRVNAVSPGTVDTPFHAATARSIMESYKDNIVMRRLGEADEIASVVAFLASEKASFLTGEIIQVNGGQAFV